MRRNLLIGGAMIAVTVALIWANHAKAEPQAASGAYCKTAEAMEEGWKYFGEHGGGGKDVVDAINAKLGEGTCGIGHVMIDRKEDVISESMVGGSKHWVSHVELTAECSMGVCALHEPRKMFMSFGDQTDYKEAAPSGDTKSLYAPNGDPLFRPM